MSFQATQPVSELVAWVHYGNIALPIQQLSFSITSSGNIIPAASTGYSIALMQMLLGFSAPVTAVNLQSSVATGIKTGAIALGFTTYQTSGVMILPFSACPWITCAPTDALALEFTGAATLSGSVNYVLIPSNPGFSVG